MGQHYSDSRRANDPTALPNVETFYAKAGEFVTEEGEPNASGWYYWFCLPGCLPDSEANGPFESEQEALADLKRNHDEWPVYADDGDQAY